MQHVLNVIASDLLSKKDRLEYLVSRVKKTSGSTEPLDIAENEIMRSELAIVNTKIAELLDARERLSAPAEAAKPEPTAGSLVAKLSRTRMHMKDLAKALSAEPKITTDGVRLINWLTNGAHVIDTVLANADDNERLLQAPTISQRVQTMLEAIERVYIYYGEGGSSVEPADGMVREDLQKGRDMLGELLDANVKSDDLPF